jgi:alpha-amylase/alpha-mannosidase (GH57 family)
MAYRFAGIGACLMAGMLNVVQGTSSTGSADCGQQRESVASSSELNPNDRYKEAPDRGTVYLNIIWHQHQPLYLNPETDQLRGPWVRTHATKDYYDMAAIFKGYPEIHANINLTSSLLLQLRDYYVKRLGPFVDVEHDTIDAKRFLARWAGKTDPWIDLALKPASSFTSADKDYLYRNDWNCFSISQVMIARFPGYLALREKLPRNGRPSDSLYTTEELREIKFYFYLAMFDPDFLAHPVKLEDGSVCDLSGYVRRGPDGRYRLTRRIDERDCRRMVVEAYKVMANVIPVHKALRYDPVTRKGQIDIITTPYYHPILPLIYDSDLARICQPEDSLPHRFSFPSDAEAQVVKAIQLYSGIFGSPPTGMWPGEGAVAQPILPLLRRHGILWTASDVKVLERSEPPGEPNSTPFHFPAGKHGISLVFRDTWLSDRIGFTYQDYTGEAAAEDFVQAILERAPLKGERDVLVTVILDGENAWEFYRKDNDGKEFLHALYRKLSKLFRAKRVVTTTFSEYLTGNPARGIAPHPLQDQPRMKWLWPGSWINANFDTWIGEDEENRAWEYLLTARRDLGASGLEQPLAGNIAVKGEKNRAASKAWEEMYAAEGSDWFWWYGNDQTAPGGDRPFDLAFIAHIKNIYRFARQAGGHMPDREFPPIIRETSQGTERTAGGGSGAMARSEGVTRTVIFQCDATQVKVTKGIFIAGSLPVLGSWIPNRVALRDDGEHGDARAEDGIWTLKVELPVGEEIQYKFTNSGDEGLWNPGDESPGRNRNLLIPPGTDTLLVRDIFGNLP